MGGPSPAYSGAEGARLGSAWRSNVKAQWTFVVAGALVTALTGSGRASRVDAGQTFGNAATSLSPDRLNELVQTRCAVCHTDASRSAACRCSRSMRHARILRWPD